MYKKISGSGTDENLVDPLTKILFQEKHNYHMNDNGIRHMDD